MPTQSQVRRSLITDVAWLLASASLVFFCIFGGVALIVAIAVFKDDSVEADKVVSAAAQFVWLPFSGVLLSVLWAALKVLQAKLSTGKPTAELQMTMDVMVTKEKVLAKEIADLQEKLQASEKVAEASEGALKRCQVTLANIRHVFMIPDSEDLLQHLKQYHGQWLANVERLKVLEADARRWAASATNVCAESPDEVTPRPSGNKDARGSMAAGGPSQAGPLGESGGES